MLPLSLALPAIFGSVFLAASLGAQQPTASEDAQSFLQAARKLRVDSDVVLAVDRLWSTDQLRTISVREFLTTYVTEDVAGAAGFDQRDAVRTFRLYQDWLNEVPLKVDRDLRSTAPVPYEGGKLRDVFPVFGTDAVINESEPNDDFTTADPVALGDVVVACNSSTTDDDWFRLVLGAPTFLDIKVDPDPAGTSCSQFLIDNDLRLYDSTGTNQIAFDASSNGGQYPRVQLTVPPGIYYIRCDASPTASEFGNYRMTVGGSPAVVLSCGQGAAGSITAPSQVYEFLVSAPANGVYRIDVATTLIGSGLDADLDLIDTDLTTLITTDGVNTGTEPSLTIGLLQGIYRCRITSANLTTGNLGVAVSCLSALPQIACGGPALSVNVSETEYPLVRLPLTSLSQVTFTVNDLGLPHDTDIRVFDQNNNEIASDLSFATQTSGPVDLLAFGNGSLFARLIKDDASTSSTTTWRDQTAADSWCRPTPTSVPYAGPTTLSADSGAGFTFVNDHVSGGNILTIRKRRQFNIDGGAWDTSTYIDLAYVDVTTAGGTTRVFPTAIRLPAPPNASGFSTIGTNGTPANAALDDGVYFAVHLLDASNGTSSAPVDDVYDIEFDFDLTTVGVLGSQIIKVDFFAEWYFGGNGSSLSTSVPPTSDDTAEEKNLYADDVQLKRHTAGTWDLIGDALMGTYTYFAPPTPVPQVDISATCTPLPTPGLLSAEDRAAGDIVTPTTINTFSFSTGTGSDFVFETLPKPGTFFTPWRDSSYAQSWGTTDPATYPGPISESRAGGLPAGAVGPNGIMRFRLLKDACIDSGSWDNYFYFDIFELGINTGGGRQPFYPVTMNGGGDVARFTTNNVVSFLPSDTNANDGVYATLRLDDYDPTIAGTATTYWVEFDFNVSSLLSQGQGGGILFSDLICEVYMEGDGFGSINSTATGNSSEEEYLLDFDLEVWDFANMTWVDYDPTPIIDPAAFTLAPSCAAQTPPVDTEIWVLNPATGEVLANNDDSGAADLSRAAVSLGSETSGQQVMVVVGLSDLASSTATTTGPYDLFVEAPSGFAGSSPFQASVGAISTVGLRARGASGDILAHQISPLPTLPSGVLLPFTFTRGLLMLNLAFTPFSFPVSIPASGIVDLPLPISPSLIGGIVTNQAIKVDLGTGLLIFQNEDTVLIVP